MARILLMGGSCHGAWCWRDVLPYVQGHHEVLALDLPGQGVDQTPIEAITLDLYAEAILDHCTSPSILVGHSMAGFAITAAALRAPEKIARLTYLAAYLPKSGQSLVQMRNAGPSQPLAEAVTLSEDRLSFSFRPELARAKFFHDCPEGTLDYALPRLRPQAIAPQHSPLMLDAAFHALPKRYIICADDRAIPPKYQELMARDANEQVSLSTSHSPFFSNPQALAAVIAA